MPTTPSTIQETHIQETHIQETLRVAVGHHEAGNLSDAEALYRQVLERAPGNAAALNLLGVLASQVGRPDAAVEFILQAIEAEPGNPSAHYTLANAYVALTRPEDAERHFRLAIAFQSNNAAAHYNLGVILVERRDLDGAQNAFRSAVQHDPTLARAWCNLGFVFQEKDDLEAAVEAYRQGLTHDATIVEGHNNLANTLARLGRVEEAIASFRAALKHDPTSATTYANLASTLREAGARDQADRGFRACLILTPGSAVSSYNYGVNCKEFKEMADAERWFRAAVTLQPGYIGAAYNLGTALFHLARHAEARDVFHQVLRVTPGHDDAWGNLGAAFQARNQPRQAEVAFRKLLCLRPAHGEGLQNIAIVHQELRQLDDAVSVSKRALVVDPQNSKRWSGHAIAAQHRGYIFAELYSKAALCLLPCDPAHYVNHGLLCQEVGQLLEAESALHRGLIIEPEDPNALITNASILAELGRFDAAMSSGLKAIELAPDTANSYHALFFYLHYHPTLDPDEYIRLYRQFGDRIARPLMKDDWGHRNDRDPNRRLKIGYVGATFYRHSSNDFFEPLLINHDHEKFEIHCYAEFIREPDSVTDRFRGYADHWTLTFGLNDEELAERVRADGIDILVDLAGHTRGGRLGVFARKPAPVSLNWLDHALTTGLTTIDYILGDPLYTPPGSEACFSEKPWALPRTVFPFRPHRPDEPVGPSPALANGYVTFGTLSRSIRVNDRVVETWARVLERAPKSKLLVFSKNYQDEGVKNELLGRFDAHGVERERIELGFNPEPGDIFRQIDIALDCFPHNSGVTLYEHAYMGHPIVTLRGQPTFGALASSLLTNIGHPEWIAVTADQYVEIAADLASDIPRLASHRERLRSEMLASPVMDGPGFARDFETACRAMWKGWCET
jgi:protein O-GlcNAc transferase